MKLGEQARELDAEGHELAAREPGRRTVDGPDAGERAPVRGLAEHHHLRGGPAERVDPRLHAALERQRALQSSLVRPVSGRRQQVQVEAVLGDGVAELALEVGDGDGGGRGEGPRVADDAKPTP
ncbi:MAG: hypothetical protein R6X02_21955 [Enhygromyxa sp.]